MHQHDGRQEQYSMLNLLVVLLVLHAKDASSQHAELTEQTAEQSLSPERLMEALCGMTNTNAVPNLVTLVTAMRKPSTPQRIALTSWSQLRPKPKLLVFVNEGDSETEALVHEFGATAVTIGNLSEWGKPYVGEIFERARFMASTPYVMYANADVVLTQQVIDALIHLHLRVNTWDVEACCYPEFYAYHSEVQYAWEWKQRLHDERLHSDEAKSSVARNKAEQRMMYLERMNEDEEDFFRLPTFVMTGTWWGLPIDKVIGNPEKLLRMVQRGNWTDEFIKRVKKESYPKSAEFVDWVVFPRYLRLPMPPFNIGLPKWDTWLINYVISSGIPLVDVSETCFVAHLQHPDTWSWNSPAAAAMTKLLPEARYPMFDMSPWKLVRCTPNTPCWGGYNLVAKNTNSRTLDGMRKLWIKREITNAIKFTRKRH